MKRLREYIKSKPNLVLSIPTFLCFLQFISTVVDLIKLRKFDYNSVIQLLSSLDGFEAFILCIVLMALKKETK